MPGSPVLVLLPAMGVAGSYYEPFLEALAGEGVAAVVADYPGHGASGPRVGRRTSYGYEDLAGEWVSGVLAATRARWPERPVVLVGHSLGGQVALAHLGSDADPGSGAQAGEVSGVVLIGSGSPWWRSGGWRPSSLSLLVKTLTVGVISRAWGYWPGHRLGFGGRQPRRLMREWASFARNGRLPVGEDALPGLDVPVLAVELANDELAPRAAIDHLVGKLSSAPVEHWLFTKSENAPGRPVDHYSFARSPEIIAQRVADWCHARVLVTAAGTSAG